MTEVRYHTTNILFSVIDFFGSEVKGAYSSAEKMASSQILMLEVSVCLPSDIATNLPQVLSWNQTHSEKKRVQGNMDKIGAENLPIIGKRHNDS